MYVCCGHGVWVYLSVCVTWLIYMCGMNHWCVWYDTHIIDVCVMNDAHEWFTSCICAAWLVHVFAVACLRRRCLLLCNTLHQTSSQYSHSNTLQDTATHCNMLQHTATHCNRRHRSIHTATHCKTLQDTATCCNTLQHAATHCNHVFAVSATWVMSHICTKCITHMHHSWHTHQWFMLHIWMSQVTHTDKYTQTPCPQHTYMHTSIISYTYMFMYIQYVCILIYIHVHTWTLCPHAGPGVPE